MEGFTGAVCLMLKLSFQLKNISWSQFRPISGGLYAPPPEPTESAPEPALPREPTESAPEPAPFLEPMESAHRAPEAAASAHKPPALPAPPWHPWLPLSQGPLPLHGPGPPIPTPTPPLLCRSPCWAIGNVWKPFLKGGVMS